MGKGEGDGGGDAENIRTMGMVVMRKILGMFHIYGENFRDLVEKYKKDGLQEMMR